MSFYDKHINWRILLTCFNDTSLSTMMLQVPTISLPLPQYRWQIYLEPSVMVSFFLVKESLPMNPSESYSMSTLSPYMDLMETLIQHGNMRTAPFGSEISCQIAFRVPGSLHTDTLRRFLSVILSRESAIIRWDCWARSMVLGMRMWVIIDAHKEVWSYIGDIVYQIHRPIIFVCHSLGGIVCKQVHRCLSWLL
jgi:hypothetical protein